MPRLHGDKIVRDVEITQVTFNQLNDAEIAQYIASGEPLDKAGAYAIQGYAARWIPRIEGCYFNVVGLPIARTIALLAEAQTAVRWSKNRDESDGLVFDGFGYSTLAIIAASRAVRGTRCSMTTDSCAA